MRLGCLLLLGMVLAAPVPAQQSPPTEAELIEATYKLLDNGTGEATIRHRIRSLTAQGRDAISKIQVPYVGAYEDVEFHFVRTIKKDGTVVDGNPASAFDSAPAGNPLLPMFTDTRLKIALPPNLDTGDAVDYEAVLHTRKWPKDGEFWFIHYPNRVIPVASETVALDLPADRHLAFYENPDAKGKTETANGRVIHRWVVKNPIGAKPSADGVPALFAVSSITNWKDFGSWIHSLNARAAEPTPEISALAAKLTQGKATDQERIAALYGFVATKIRYIAVAFGIGRLQPHLASAVLHNGYGDCKDQTALLSALLTASGFKPKAVLTTPGAGVRIRDVPLTTQFSHEFTALEMPSGRVFLDPSLGPAAPQVMGLGVRGRAALLVGDGDSALIEIPAKPPVPSLTAIDLKGRIGADGAFDGALHFELRGLPEVGVRRVFLDAALPDKEKLLRQLAGPEMKDAVIRQITNSDPADLSKPFTVECEIHARDFFPPSQSSARITFEVMPPAVLQMIQMLGAIGKPQKPIPMEASINRRHMDLEIDTSYTITDRVAVHKDAPFGGFDSEFSYAKGHLRLKRSYEMNGAPIEPGDWDKFVEIVRAAQSEAAQGFLLTRRGPPVITGNATPLSRAFETGNAAMARRDFEAAKKAYLEATTISPQSVNAWLALGNASQMLRDYAKAEEAYKRAIQLEPRNRSAHGDLGNVYRAQHRLDDAIAAYKTQAELTPNDARIHDALAIAYAGKQQWEASRAAAARAVEISPETPIRWCLIGRAQAKTGATAQAIKSFDRALSLVHNPMTENDVAYFMSESGIQLERAWKLVSGALDPLARGVCEPNMLAREDACAAPLRQVAHLLDTAAWVLYRQGKAEEAEPYAAASYAIAPAAEVALHLAAISAKRGRTQDAVRYFAEAQASPAFGVLDAGEIRAAIGEERLKEMPPRPAVSARVLVLVDEKGNVIDAQAADAQCPPAAVAAARSLTLAPIAWPGHTLKSLRLVELAGAGERWTPVRSYAGAPPD
jgi:tetratricopeptide (TPR) repeat protein/transglutaminase-like putative cysteine protease